MHTLIFKYMYILYILYNILTFFPKWILGDNLITYLQRSHAGGSEHVVPEPDVTDSVAGREEGCLDSEHIPWILFGAVHVDEVA